MKRTYETVVIFDGSLAEDVLKKEQEVCEDYFKTNADFLRVDVWGKKKLAFDIKKKKIGFYCLFLYNGESDICEKFYKSFKLNSKILRYQTVLYEEVKDINPDEVQPIIDSNEVEEQDDK